MFSHEFSLVFAHNDDGADTHRSCGRRLRRQIPMTRPMKRPCFKPRAASRTSGRAQKQISIIYYAANKNLIYMKTKLLLFVTTLLLPCLTASAVVSGWGDSLTFGSGGGGAGYLEQFQTLSGQAIYKQGWGGSNSTWIKDQFLLQSSHWG
ncbi:MAG: hypothetical protein WCS42_20795, partial [Verrucomicrobiota bacterium]